MKSAVFRMFKIIRRKEMDDGTMVLNEIETFSIASKAKYSQIVILKANDLSKRIQLLVVEEKWRKVSITIGCWVAKNATSAFKTMEVVKMQTLFFKKQAKKFS